MLFFEEAKAIVTPVPFPDHFSKNFEEGTEKARKEERKEHYQSVFGLMEVYNKSLKTLLFFIYFHKHFFKQRKPPLAVFVVFSELNNQTKRFDL